MKETLKKQINVSKKNAVTRAARRGRTSQPQRCCLIDCLVFIIDLFVSIRQPALNQIHIR